MPFVSEPAVLLEMLPPPKLVDRLAAAVTGSAQKSMKEKLPDIATSMVTWRSPKVKYAANEIYFDIVDTVDATMRLDGRLVSCEVRSTIEANCKLSGMPDLTMAFADTSPLRDARFHPCVRVKRFRSDGVLSFVPPDGSFRLADFCPPAPKGGLLPIYVTPQLAWEIVEAGARSGGDVAGEQGQGSPGGSSAGCVRPRRSYPHPFLPMRARARAREHVCGPERGLDAFALTCVRARAAHEGGWAAPARRKQRVRVDA